MFNKILIIMKRLFVIFALMVFSKLSFAQRFQYSEEVQFGRFCFIIEVNCGGTVTDPQTGGTKCILDGWIYTSDCSGNKTGDSSVYHVERPITPNSGVWRWATQTDGYTVCNCYEGALGCKRWEKRYHMTRFDFASLADQMLNCCGTSGPCDTVTIDYDDSLCIRIKTHCCNGALNIMYILYNCNSQTTVFVDEFAVDIVNPNNMYSIDAYDNMQTIGDDSGTFTDEKRWSILESYLNFCYNHSKEPCE